MAFRAFLVAICIAVAIVPALATEYMVGDDGGWRLDGNYTQWAAGKDFRVGDKLTFMYNATSHNVLKVDKTDFQNCKNSNASQAPLTSGNDVIPLTSPGKKWYICGISDHCTKGMKLVINVSPAEGPAPSPMPGASPPGTSAAAEVSPLKACAWMLAVMTAYRMIMA